RIIGASKVARDVTARRIADETLQKQSDRLRLLWESAAVLLTAEDPDAMMRALFARIAPHLQLDAYLNFVPAESGDALVLVSYGGISEEQAQSIRKMEHGRSASGAGD